MRPPTSIPIQTRYFTTHIPFIPVVFVIPENVLVIPVKIPDACLLRHPS